MNRNDFLENVKQSLNASYLPDARAQRPLSPEMPPFSPADLVPQFTQEAEALKAEIHRANTEADVLSKIVQIFEDFQTQEYIAWAGQALPIPYLKVRLAEHGLTEREFTVSNHPAARTKTLQSLSDVQIGITGALAGLADTGSLVVPGGIGQSRLASLLPMVHIALLKVDDLFPTLAHFVDAYPDAARDTANLNIISGPSRTADIEQTLTLGVHGPKFVHIILV